jgi:site-specific recombinase XerC
MSQAIDTYVDYLRDVRRMSPNTISSYARDLAGLAAFADRKGKSVESLERRDLEAFTRDMMTQGLAPRSVARAIACVRGLYKFLLVEKRIARILPRTCGRRGPGLRCRSISICRSGSLLRSRTSPPRGCATRR